ncbi:hypothetical protein AJ80_04368 [Polytolypa hystricis UAMH7299]|uniref:AN1-type domain-containing protein n=1 Tax=Polytolypa hystricis (strain UAMH7299) TaxID=1447883 RepID=A0A2B7YBR9_POLH7|nr:hypothetical protein AJ80_04368 [Polytolypa hystricis UAMH7299]
MISRSSHFWLLFLFLSLVSSVFAAAPTSFCKCTCFSNSTIIQLGKPNSESSIISRSWFPHGSDSSSSSSIIDDRLLVPRASSDKDDKKFRALNCNDCNRRFCLDYGLPKCKGATEADVVTTCFRRQREKLLPTNIKPTGIGDPIGE